MRGRIKRGGQNDLSITESIGKHLRALKMNGSVSRWAEIVGPQYLAHGVPVGPDGKLDRAKLQALAIGLDLHNPPSLLAEMLSQPTVSRPVSPSLNHVYSRGRREHRSLADAFRWTSSKLMLRFRNN